MNGLIVQRIYRDRPIVAVLESQLQQLQQQIDFKAIEALAAVNDLAKALKLLGAAA